VSCFLCLNFTHLSVFKLFDNQFDSLQFAIEPILSSTYICNIITSSIIIVA